MVTKINVLRRSTATTAVCKNRCTVSKKGGDVKVKAKRNSPCHDPNNGRKQKDAKMTVDIDLSDVPKQQPIRGSSGTSQYVGVCFDQKKNKWKAQIVIDGTKYIIGEYDDEEAAAVDYARARSKYKIRRRRQNKSLDLTGIPLLLPLLSNACNSSTKSSKYVGVSYSKEKNKWLSHIKIQKRLRFIGYFDDERDAAVAYARAAFKYKER